MKREFDSRIPLKLIKEQEHYCDSVETFPLEKFLQIGTGRGGKVLILGESPAPNGWRISGKAFYNPEGRLLPTGKNLNKLLANFDLSVEICGFTELVKCYIGKERKLLNTCGPRCWPIFLRQIKNKDYLLILILGVKTLDIFNKLLNTHLVIGELTKANIENKGYKVLPIYHPSPIAPFNHSKNTEIFRNLETRLKALI